MQIRKNSCWQNQQTPGKSHQIVSISINNSCFLMLQAVKCSFGEYSKFRNIPTCKICHMLHKITTRLNNVENSNEPNAANHTLSSCLSPEIAPNLVSGKCCTNFKKSKAPHCICCSLLSAKGWQGVPQPCTGLGPNEPTSAGFPSVASWMVTVEHKREFLNQSAYRIC